MSPSTRLARVVSGGLDDRRRYERIVPTSFTGEPVWERRVGIDWRRSGPGLVELTGWVPIDDVELRPMSPATKCYRWAQVTLESPIVGGITEPPVPLVSVSEVDGALRIVTRCTRSGYTAARGKPE